MLRGGGGVQWKANQSPEDLELRRETFIRWFQARQNGVIRARAEAGPSLCRVWHAIEVNRVFDSLLGIPTVCDQVLPHVEVDLISWSAYDGMRVDDHGTGDEAAIGVWQGMELIRRYARTTERDSLGRPAVMLGEFGVAENVLATSGKSADAILEGTLAAALAQDATLLHYWQLYCNEPLDRSLRDIRLKRNLAEEELRGLWLIKPDGELSAAGRFFARLLNQTGLEDEATESSGRVTLA
jgi:hypothetical protein